MYGLAVQDVLELTSFQDHQSLMTQGKLVEIQPGMACIFVSHQWEAYQHPDPEKTQLKCLQRILQRLIAGELDVDNDWKQQILTKERCLMKKQWWKNSMKTMYIWLVVRNPSRLSCT
jgi:hypothetical protein